MEMATTDNIRHRCAGIMVLQKIYIFENTVIARLEINASLLTDTLN